MSAPMNADYKLQTGVVDVWLCRLSLFLSAENDYYQLLSELEKSRAERFKFAVHRSRFIISHGFTRLVLSRYLNIKPANIQFSRGAQGKPYVYCKSTANCAVQFNLSHSEDTAVLAIMQDVQTGIDIEYMQRKTDWQGIVQRFFTDSEQQALFELTAERQKSAFFELWTRKEAYMKVLGTGLSLAPRQFCLSVPPAKPILLEHYSTRFKSLKQLDFSNIHLPEGFADYCATVAAGGRISRYSLYQFD